MELPTYTNIWRIEKRLYKLYDFRLPMPLPIGQLVVFAAIAAPYVLVLALLGIPLSHTLVWLYILPPGALTWLVTRPVLEGKRLPELVTSQIRYLSEPRTWCRMAPLAEKDEIALVGRVWRQARPLQLATAGADARAADLAAPGVSTAESPVPGVPVPGVPVPGVPVADVKVPGPPVPGAPVADVPAAGGPAGPTAARAAGLARARWPQASGGMSAATMRLARAGGPESGTGWPGASAGRPASSARLTGTGWPEGASARPAAAGDRAMLTPGAAAQGAQAAGPRATTGSPAAGRRQAPAERPASGRPAANGNGRAAASGWPEAASARPASPAPPQAGRSAARTRGPAPEPGSSGRSAIPPGPAPARVVARPVPRPAVTITGDPGPPRPMRVVERALGGPSGQRAGGWNEHVVIVPGGHRPGHPDQRERDRIRARMPLGDRRRVVLLGCTVGAGQTTTTLLTGRTLAALRDEPVAVLDLNPAGRDSLTERARTVTGLLPASGGPGPAGPDCSDADSGLQVITGSSPAGDDAGRVIEVVAARYPLTLTDPAAGAVPGALAVADQLVLIAPASADAANAIAMTYEWLEAHGYARLAAAAITVLNGVSQQTMPQVEKAAAVARGRCRAIVRVPWDDRLRDLPPRHRTAAGAPEGAYPGEPLGPAAAQSYEALAGLLVASLAGAGDLRGARA